MCNNCIINKQIRWAYITIILGTFAATIDRKHVSQPLWIPVPNLDFVSQMQHCPQSGVRSKHCPVVTGQSALSRRFPSLMDQRLDHFDSILDVCLLFNVYRSVPVLRFVSNHLHPDQKQRYADRVDRRALTARPRQGCFLLFVGTDEQEEMKLINILS